MNLTDEIIIIQFAQGHHPEADLLDRFGQLTEEDQRKRIFELSHMLERYRLPDSDIQQANALGSSGDTPIPFLILHAGYTGLARPGLRINMADGELERSFTILLSLVKKAYQRYVEQEKAAPANWWYWDLSNSETVQNILSRHQELVEELYNTPSFRSEFTSLTKLWHDNHVQTHTMAQEPDSHPEAQTHFHFLSYTEMLEKSVVSNDNKISHAIYILLNSLRKAISVRYSVDADNARRVVLDVMGKHFLETYNRQYDQH